VEIPYGDQYDVGYNLLAESLYSEVNSEGNQFRLFHNIINHRRSRAAVEISKGKRHKKSILASWELKVERAESTTS